MADIYRLVRFLGESEGLSADKHCLVLFPCNSSVDNFSDENLVLPGFCLDLLTAWFCC